MYNQSLMHDQYTAIVLKYYSNLIYSCYMHQLWCNQYFLLLSGIEVSNAKAHTNHGVFDAILRRKKKLIKDK